MRKRDHKALAAYVRQIADLMELRDWSIELRREPADDGDLANTHVIYGQKLAAVWVCADFRARDLWTQKRTVIHELVHLHLESATSMVQGDLDEHLGALVKAAFWAGFVRQIEYGVDAIATALAKHLPDIDWPGG